jgi:Spy/CpxP family protein refolding chaperone
MSDNKFNWQIRTAALSIFFLGFLGGALALNAYQTWFGGASSQETKSQRFERIFDQLELSDAQKADVSKIVGETRDEIQNLKKERDLRIREIRGRSDERFKQIFTAEQWTKFQRLRDELRQNEKNENGVKH